MKAAGTAYLPATYQSPPFAVQGWPNRTPLIQFKGESASRGVEPQGHNADTIGTQYELLIPETPTLLEFSASPHGSSIDIDSVQGLRSNFNKH